MTLRARLIAAFVASLVMVAGFDADKAGMQWNEHMAWLPDVGINYDLGVDGVSVFLIVLTTLLSVISIVAGGSRFRHPSSERMLIL